MHEFLEDGVCSFAIHTGGLWCLVNNAGIAIFTECEWCSMDTYQRSIEVNLLGTIRVTKAFLPLVRQSQGRVVNMASLSGMDCRYVNVTAHQQPWLLRLNVTADENGVASMCVDLA